MTREIFKRLPFPLSAEHKLVMALALALLALCAVAIGFQWEARQAALEHAKRANRNLVVSVLDQVDAAVHEADILLGLVERHLQGASRGPALGADFPAIAHHHVTARPVMQDLYVHDSRGRLLFSLNTPLHRETLPGTRDLFEHHRDSRSAAVRLGRPLRTEPQGEWVIPVSRRLLGPDDTFLGVAVVALSVKQLGDYLSKFDLGPGGLLALKTSEATVLVRHPFIEGAVGADLRDSPLHQNHFSRSRSGSFIEISPIDGIERQYSFRHSSVYPLMTVVAMSKEHALAEWQREAWRNAGVIAVLLLLIGAVGRHTLRALEDQQRLTRELEASNRRLADMERAVDEHASVVISDVQGNIVAVNKKFAERSQYAREELIGSNLRLLKSGRHPPSFFEEMWRTISHGGVWTGEIENRVKDGSTCWMATTIVPFLDEARQPYQYISIRTDITERKQAEQELARLNSELAKLATRDELTGLANRRRFKQVLDVEFKRAQREATRLSVLIFDVDFFKRFNDSYGHLAGDDCLRRIAEVARSVCRRPGDLAARWGGEEFVVLLPRTDDDGAQVVAQRLRSEVQALGIEHRGSPQGVATVSVGVHCIAPGPAQGNPEELLRCADLALYEAKRTGRNHVVLYRALAEAATSAASLPGSSGKGLI